MVIPQTSSVPALQGCEGLQSGALGSATPIQGYAYPPPRSSILYVKPLGDGRYLATSCRGPCVLRVTLSLGMSPSQYVREASRAGTLIFCQSAQTHHIFMVGHTCEALDSDQLVHLIMLGGHAEGAGHESKLGSNQHLRARALACSSLR